MKNILAENLLRFGVKNLSEQQLQRISILIKEQATTKAMPAIDIATLRSNQFFTTAENIVKPWIVKNKIPFGLPDASALVTIIAASSRKQDGWFGNDLRKGQTTQMLSKLNQSFVDAVKNTIDNSVEDVIQFNEHPEQKGKVLTVGTVTATSFQPGDANGSSTIQDIMKFFNDYNLSSQIANWGAESPVITPYKPTSNGIITGGDFVEGRVKKDPGAGALDMTLVIPGIGGDRLVTYFLGAARFEPSSAKTAGGMKTQILWTPGPETTADLGKELFKTGTITPSPTLAEKVKEAVDGAKAMGTILSVRIESGASFDRPVNTDRNGFAQMVGMPVDKVPADPRKDIQGIVKDPMAGGNSFLAYYRGVAIQRALGNQAGVAPTMIAKVENGGDQAQYAKLIFSIKKADQSTTTTQADINSIGAGSTTTDMIGMFKAQQFYI
jgi:hypothetical protein